MQAAGSQATLWTGIELVMGSAGPKINPLFFRLLLLLSLLFYAHFFFNFQKTFPDLSRDPFEITPLGGPEENGVPRHAEN